MHYGSKGWYVEELKKLTSERSLVNNVEFNIKYLSESDVFKHIRAADVMIFTYLHQVGPSGVLALALYHETPVIVNEDGDYISSSSDLPALIIKGNDKFTIERAFEQAINKQILYKYQTRINLFKKMYKLSNIVKLHLEKLYV